MHYSKNSIIKACHNEIQTNWSVEDDAKMLELVQANRFNWKKISKKFQNFQQKKVTPLFLKNRYRQLKHENKITQSPLGEKEDKLLVNAIENFGMNGWSKLYEAVPYASQIQVRNRYYSKLRNKAYYDEVL